jgi:ribosomal protein L11 methyltransferase
VPTYTLTLETGKAEAEDLAGMLVLEGADGVEVRDGEGTAMPGVPPPPPGRAVLVAFYADRADAALAAAEHGGRVEELPEEDWGETWKKDLRPLTAGRVFVRPSWIDAPPPPGAVEVVLDPGMAFGTGSHPTTALCLEALSDALAARPGASVLDVGTGSGLLAIAAAKLGARRVAGNDNDPVAVKVAVENAEANHVSVTLTTAGLEALEGGFDVVVANILANTLVELAPAVRSRLAPGGLLFLAGILGPQEDEVRDAYLALGLTRRPGLERREGEWSLLALEGPRP